MIRVMRLMQYEYPDVETAVNDMARWNVQGVKIHGFGSKRMVIKSTVLPIELDAEGCRDLNQNSGSESELKA